MLPTSIKGEGSFQELSNLNGTEIEVAKVSQTRLKIYNLSATEIVYVKDATMGGDETTCDQFIAPKAYEIIDVVGGSAFFYATTDVDPHMVICEVK